MKYQGHRVMCKDHEYGDRVYVVLPDGASWIPGPEVAIRLFGPNWAQNIMQLTLEQFKDVTIIEPLSQYAVRAYGNPEDPNKQYLVSNNQKRWLAGPEVLDKYDFEDGSVESNQVLLPFIPDGPDIT